MSSYDFDLFTIGAGSGGVRASRIAAGFGARVAVAESRYLGGTCVNVGCVPKKLMVYASHFHEEFQNAKGFGWNVGDSTFDWKAFLANKDKEILRLNSVYRRLLEGTDVKILEGSAKIVAPHTIEVIDAEGKTKKFTAEHILIATGGKPVYPENISLSSDRVWVSDDLFKLPSLPKSIVVVGAGYIGVEFACIFQGLGVNVSMIHRGPHLLSGFDDDLRTFVAEEMKKKGISIHFNQKIASIETNEDGCICVLSHEETISADAILFAIGRRPNIDQLGLENVDVKCNEKGAIQIDDMYRTSAENIYALGDVTDRVNLTPVALEEGMALAKTLFGKESAKVNYDNIATAVFSQPPLGTVGLTEAEARDKYKEIDVYISEFTPLKHTLSGNSERTFMKLIVEKESDRVIGVHMVGTDAPEIIQMAGIALKCNATKAQFDATIGVHPTAAEEFVTMRTPRHKE